jgi:hypothetical protein
MTRLSPKDVALVRRTIQMPASLDARFTRAREAGLTLDDTEADVLLELVTDRLMVHGFDDKYRQTSEGVALERLIDRLTEETDAPENASKG